MTEFSSFCVTSDIIYILNICLPGLVWPGRDNWENNFQIVSPLSLSKNTISYLQTHQQPHGWSVKDSSINKWPWNCWDSTMVEVQSAISVYSPSRWWMQSWCQVLHASPSWYLGQVLAGCNQHQVILLDVFNLINDWIYPLYLGMLR